MHREKPTERSKFKTHKCVKFLDRFTKMRPSLNGEAEERQAIIVSMREAGYKQKDDAGLLRQGRELLATYDKLAENAKDIFDSIGLSARRMAELLRDIAQNGRSETARVQALNIATKCLGLQREKPEIGEGAQIIIMRRNEPQRAPKTVEKAPNQATEVTSIYK